MQADLEFAVPLPDENGILKLDTGDYRVVELLRAGPLYNPWSRSIADFYVVSVIGVLSECIRDGLTAALADAYIGCVVTSSEVESRVWKAIRIHKCVQWLSPYDKGYPDRLHVELYDPFIEERLPIPDAHHVLDYCTQSQGHNVGLSMYRCEKVEIDESGVVTKRGEPYSRILRENLLFPECSRRRMTASNINAVVPLTDGEDPICHHPDYEHGMLSGLHLNTALMAWYTCKESIAVRRSAASRMSSIVWEQQVLLIPADINNFHLFINEGDEVEPGQEIARHPRFKRLGHERDSYACRISGNGWVEEIREDPYLFQGQHYRRIHIGYKRVHQLQTGDKLTNRSGGKGVVHILDDQLMPPGIDICASPLAVVKRRNIGMLAEMMANELAVKDGLTDVHYEHYMPGNRIKDFWEQGAGRKREVMWNGPCWIYSAPVYWVALDKWSDKAWSMTYDHNRLDPNGQPISNGAVSGTKVGLTELALMASGKGWGLGEVGDWLFPNLHDESAKTVRDVLTAFRS